MDASKRTRKSYKEPGYVSFFSTFIYHNHDWQNCKLQFEPICAYVAAVIQ